MPKTQLGALVANPKQLFAITFAPILEQLAGAWHLGLAGLLALNLERASWSSKVLAFASEAQNFVHQDLATYSVDLLTRSIQ